DRRHENLLSLSWPEDLWNGLGLGLNAAAGELAAGAGRHIYPGIALVVGGSRSSAGVRVGLAIVHAGLGYAVTFLEREFRRGGRPVLTMGDAGYCQRGHRGDGRGSDVS